MKISEEELEQLGEYFIDNELLEKQGMTFLQFVHGYNLGLYEIWI